MIKVFKLLLVCIFICFILLASNTKHMG